MRKLFQIGGMTVGVLALILLVAGGHAMSAQYSNASLTGTYVFNASGISQLLLPGQSSSAPGYTVTLGTLTIDGAGNGRYHQDEPCNVSNHPSCSKRRYQRATPLGATPASSGERLLV